jgi:hypothetical protein
MEKGLFMMIPNKQNQSEENDTFIRKCETFLKSKQVHLKHSIHFPYTVIFQCEQITFRNH